MLRSSLAWKAKAHLSTPNPLNYMAYLAGLEPATKRLEGAYSSIEL